MSQSKTKEQPGYFLFDFCVLLGMSSEVAAVSFLVFFLAASWPPIKLIMSSMDWFPL